MNLSQWADRKVGELSGGMQQRVGLARAFVTDAPILLMDEPFSALDPLIRSRLQDELLDLQDKLKRTIVFVSHDLDEAFKLGDRIALMEGGRIVQCGTAREIIANPVSEYVADFVAHMNPLGVLTARDVMESGEPRANARPLPADMPVRDIMEMMSQGITDMVVQENGRNLGMIGNGDVRRVQRSLVGPRSGPGSEDYRHPQRSRDRGERRRGRGLPDRHSAPPDHLIGGTSPELLGTCQNCTTFCSTGLPESLGIPE